VAQISRTRGLWGQPGAGLAAERSVPGWPGSTIPGTATGTTAGRVAEAPGRKRPCRVWATGP